MSDEQQYEYRVHGGKHVGDSGGFLTWRKCRPSLLFDGSTWSTSTRAMRGRP